MIVLATAKVGADAAKKSKARKQLSAQRQQEKREVEIQGEELLRKQKVEALKSIAISYAQSQQKAIEDAKVKKQKEKERNIQIAVAVGLGLAIIGFVAYKTINK
jgi:hypothetical protein